MKLYQLAIAHKHPINPLGNNHLPSDGHKGDVHAELKLWRERAGLTLEQAAVAIGVASYSTVWRWESGERAPGSENYRKAMTIYRRLAEERHAGNVPRGTNGREGAQGFATRTKRIELFEREMIRLGADDFDADYVRRAARDFIEQIHSAGGTDVDEELETYLEYSLRPWVLKRIDQRRRRSEQQDAEDQGLDG
jgi:transcriptional regulator with XRE-family HTH domain